MGDPAHSSIVTHHGTITMPNHTFNTKLITAMFPIVSQLRDHHQHNLELIETGTHTQDLTAVLRLVGCRDEDGLGSGNLSVCFVKEQVVLLQTQLMALDPERAGLVLQAWAEAVEMVLTAANCESMMPDDFVGRGKKNYLGQVFSLKRANTKDDFLAAFMVKSRLGKFMPKAEKVEPPKRAAVRDINAGEVSFAEMYQMAKAKQVKKARKERGVSSHGEKLMTDDDLATLMARLVAQEQATSDVR